MNSYPIFVVDYDEMAQSQASEELEDPGQRYLLQVEATTRISWHDLIVTLNDYIIVNKQFDS